MKKSFYLILIFICFYLIFTGQKNPDDKTTQLQAPPIWNIHKLMKWYTDRGMTPPQFIASEFRNNRFPNGYDDGPDVRVYPSSNPQSENSIAISQFNSQHLFISTNMALTQSWFFSTNGGANWFGSENNPINYPVYGDPVAIFDKAGNAYWVTLTSPGGVGLTKTTNFGTNWGPLWYADPVSNTGDDKEHAMADLSGIYPDNIYLALSDFSVNGAPVRFMRSTNGGENWSSSIILQIGYARGQGVNIQTGPKGEVYVAWAHYPGTAREYGIGFARSTDGGATFDTPVIAFPINGIRVYSTNTEFGDTRVASFPSMAVDCSGGIRRGWIYIIYPDRSTGDADVYLNRSTDGGATWSPKIRVNGEPVGNGKQQWMSSGAVDPTNGAICVSYYSMDTTGLLTARYLATSLDGGTSWDRTKISDVRFTPSPIPGFGSGYMGDYYETAAYGGKVIPCWSDNRSGQWQAYVRTVTLGPAITHFPLPNTENLTGPYNVNATIAPAGVGLVTAKTKVYWGRNSLTDSITMTNSSGNNWTTFISGNGLPAEYRYYIKTIDSLGRITKAPRNAPSSYYSFLASSDTTRPVISHSQLGDQAKATWPVTVTANVTDNIGIDSVWVMWNKNSHGIIKEFNLLRTEANIYSAPFNSLNSDVNIGDSIFYKIYALDNSINHNRDSTSLYKIKIVNDLLSEGFSLQRFPPGNWALEFSGKQFWQREIYSSYGIGQGSAIFPFFDAFAGVEQSMISLTFANTVEGDILKFDHAYRTYINEIDQLEIETSTDAGTTFSRLMLLNGGASGPLATMPPGIHPFYPQPNQWATKKFALPAGTNKVKFTAISAYGNNLFLDSICVVSVTGISIHLSSTVPENYSLSQNYPNPFNPVTKINFSILKQGLVVLKIYDILGKEVVTLVNENKTAGNYSADFNAAIFSSGIYFYKLVSGDFADIKKMMLIK